MMISIEELQKVTNNTRNSGIDTINTHLKTHLDELNEQAIQSLSPSEAVAKFNDIISIIVEDNKKLKYKKFNSLSEVKEMNNDFPKFFLSICKNLSDCINREEAIKVCEDFSSAFAKDKYDENSIKGFTARSVSEILHCIQPCYIPILSKKLNGDIYEICCNANYESKDFGSLNKNNKKNFEDFANNIRILYDFCENKYLPKKQDGYDFALIDDAILNKNILPDNETVIQNDGGNEMSENNNKEFDKNMILFGPPGTGKTYNTVIYAVAICGGEVKDKDYSEILIQYNELKELGRIAFTTFHQSYGYEEFIEGIKPVIENGQNSADSNANEDAKETNNEADNKSKDVKYEIKSGVFKSFCDVAKKDPDNSYVFIIDEINRGNISKIFGELITLIEPTKRTGEAEAMEAILPYSNEPFGVPKNVYIIGTMNTADRSIALMDTALRRRFQFVEMLPDPEVLKVDKDNDIIVSENKNGNLIEVNVKTLLTKINKRIEYLYDREHTIGHAFFTKLNNDSKVSDLGKIFEKSVIPLLQEYFYDDYKKIMLVLGYDPKPNDNNKTNQSPNKQEDKKNDQLIIATKLEKSSIFKGDTSDIDIPEYSYEIDKDAFKNIESYMKICN